MKRTPTPPRWADRLLSWFCAPHLLEEVQGDLYERFQRRVTLFGEHSARQQYVWDVLSFIKPFAIKRKSNQTTSPFIFSHDMIKNYLKIAIRNLQRQRLYAVINVLGLAVGLACCLTIYLFIKDELRYDTFHEKADRVYRLRNDRITEGRVNHMARSAPAYGPAMKAYLPEVEKIFRIFTFNDPLVVYNNNRFKQTGFILADSTIFDVLTLPLVRGNKEEALKGQGSLVISEAMAERYFGKEDPLNKILKVDGGLEFRVTGVMLNMPRHSHLELNAIGSFNTLRDIISDHARLESWGWQQMFTYVLLTPGADPARVNDKITAMVERYANPEQRDDAYRTTLQPLKDIYLHSAELEYDLARKGNIRYVYAFAIVALITLLIACFNFMNLSTARSMQRAKEVGLRKSIGAQRSQLVGQFLGESMVLTALAMVLAIGLTAVVLPVLNSWAGKELSLLDALSPLFLVQILAALLVVGLLAGLYPAFFLSAFQPIKVLKGTLETKAQGGYGLRKTLVVVQFAVSTALIIGAGVVYYQLNYVQQKNLGFNKEQLVIMPFQSDDMRRDYKSIKQELLQNPNILSATACYGLPGGMFAGDGVKLPGQGKEVGISMFLIDPDYIPTMGMELVAGRNLSEQYGTDVEEAFLINETAVKALGWSTPEQALGKEMLWPKWVPANPADTLKRGKVIGVVKDFHYKSLHQKIEPLVLHVHEPAYYTMVARVRPEKMAAALDFLKTEWEARAPEFPFEYEILDQQFAKFYDSEQIFKKLFLLFTSLSIFIACLGLLGLATFMAQQRTKEIGIRKVMGASVAGIVMLLSKDFLKLVMVGIIIASPLAWYFMNQWLQSFSYRVDIAWWIFGLAGLLVVGVALLTVSFQSIKAALMNPIQSLRSE
ncbi:permease prefix domain 2-containing transporter [Telluribacter sp. SYSU D00476]|uniref:permease prefix domain 2-containing transporter n=1 Tax=Telluribacter sp. SYSU D00476 TaxID=2811430 RepID=UPI001FF386D2|nr:permease prefix domain 2-containing transporter [Telluribacter sp. SYSU D00476]